MTIKFTQEQIEKIKEMYNDNLINTNKLGKLMNCSSNVIQRILKENNIKIRPAKFYIKGRSSKIRIIKNEQEVIDMYGKEISGTKIAEHFNCDNSVIYDILKRNNIKTKGHAYFNKGKISPLKNITFEERYGEEKAKEMKEKIPNRRKFTLEQEKEILDLYNNKLMKIRGIGKKFNCSEKPITRILRKYNINTKQSHRMKLLFESGKITRINQGCFKKGDLRIIGKNNTNFNNYSSFEPYGREFNKHIRKKIKERDGCCMLCNIGFEDLKLLKRKVHIHHINYDKQCTFIENLISLCNSCHTKTNHNRPPWTKFFQSLLAERYEYKYSETGEIILEINKLEGIK